MKYQSINFQQKFGLLAEHWAPRVIAEMNDYQFKVVKLMGDFIWHDHKDTDETFVVLEGDLRIDFRDGAVRISAGEMFVVPKGTEHKPYAAKEVKLLLIEPRGVLNTATKGANERPQTTFGFDQAVAVFNRDGKSRTQNYFPFDKSHQKATPIGQQRRQPGQQMAVLEKAIADWNLVRRSKRSS